MVVAAPARALDPPPAGSFAGVVAEVESALSKAQRIAAMIGVAPAVSAAEKACARLLAAPDSCTLPADDGCGAALSELFAALRDVRPTLSPRRAAAADRIAAEVFAAASRLGVARAALARGACRKVAIPAGEPTQMLLGPDGQTIVVRPLTALRAGRRYAVVAQGIDRAALPQLRESLMPKPEARGLAIPEDAFVTPIAAALPDDAGGISIAGTEDFLRRLDRDAAAMPGLGAFTGVRVTLPEPVRAAQIGLLQLSFVPAQYARAEDTLATFTVLDARAGLVQDRARLTTLDCETAPAEVRDMKETLGFYLPHVAQLLHGRYRSLDVTGSAADENPLGVPASAARPIELPYLLALPHDFGPDTPLVLLVDGHAGSAARILGKHAAALTERGLAALAVELPAHGERAVAGKDFVEALDPAALGRTMRQAVVDVLAAIQSATRCGLALPDGKRLRVPGVRYLGYSLGGMIGTIVRSVEPTLGTTVLAAPGGDILGWLVLRISPALGATFVTCLGGPQEGESCIPDGACEPPGTCIVDPYLDRLGWLVTLPYGLAAAAADPLSYVTHRTGTAAGKGRLLLITGGGDAALHPALASRLADAYGMQPVAPHRRRGPRSLMVQWPELGHELVDRPGVRAQIAEFLGSDGRRVLLAQEPASPTAPGWYQVYGPSRK